MDNQILYWSTNSVRSYARNAELATISALLVITILILSHVSTRRRHEAEKEAHALDLRDFEALETLKRCMMREIVDLKQDYSAQIEANQSKVKCLEDQLFRKEEEILSIKTHKQREIPEIEDLTRNHSMQLGAFQSAVKFLEDQVARKEALIKSIKKREEHHMREIALLNRNRSSHFGAIQDKVKCLEEQLVRTETKMSSLKESYAQLHRHLALVKESREEVDRKVRTLRIDNRQLTSERDSARVQQEFQDKRIRKQEEEKLCRICFENARDTCFVGCGHFYYCGGCAENFENCPICRKAITNSQKLFF